MPGHGTSGPAPHSTGHRAWAGQWRQAWPAEPRARLGWTPGQLDSRADQPRVSPSCPEWPARSQSRIPPQSELPSWAGNARLPLMTSGCLPRAASGGGCLLPEAFATVVLLPADGRRARGARVPHHRALSWSPQRSDALPGPEPCIYRQMVRRPDSFVYGRWRRVGGGTARESHTVNLHGCSVFSGSGTSAC